MVATPWKQFDSIYGAGRRLMLRASAAFPAGLTWLCRVLPARAEYRAQFFQCGFIERLGPVVWERSVAQASYALEELEETARLWLMANPRPAPLDEAALEELRAVFGARW
jgi:ribulose-5-phosphate 4-epimerase/fuculose-1-phosphate aldolase